AIAGVYLRGHDVASCGIGELSLPFQRDAKILEGIVPPAVDLDRLPAVCFAFGEPTQSVEAIAEIVVDQIPRSRRRWFQRKGFLVKPDRRFVVAEPVQRSGPSRQYWPLCFPGYAEAASAGACCPSACHASFSRC